VAAVYPADELARLVSDPGSYLGTPDGVAPSSDP
jgi:hypothetical protein